MTVLVTQGFRDDCDCVGYAGLSEMIVTVLVTQGCLRCL